MAYEPLAAKVGRMHVCAHRGYSAVAPENTIPAIEAAAAAGATCCEIDVVLTKDEEIVLAHDEILDRTTDGKGRVADYTMAALRRLDAGSWLDPRFAGTRLPTLGEVIAVARLHRLGLLVEIKERQQPERLIARLADLLLETGAMGDLLVISFDHPSLLRAQAAIPGLRTELITHARHVDPVGLARRAAATSVSIEWDMFHEEDAAALHEAGIAVRLSIPRPAKLEQRRSYGLDPIPALGAAMSRGLIDVLAGDDTSYVAALVKRYGVAGSARANERQG